MIHRITRSHKKKISDWQETHIQPKDEDRRPYFKRLRPFSEETRQENKIQYLLTLTLRVKVQGHERKLFHKTFDLPLLRPKSVLKTPNKYK